MKKIKLYMLTSILLTVIMLGVLPYVNAQSEKPYIEVNGLAEYNLVAQQYEAAVVLSPTLDYNYPAAATYSQIRKDFLDAVVKNGFKEEEFKEDKLAFMTGDYQGKGGWYKFQTSGAETFLKLKELEKIRGVRVLYKKVGYKMGTDAGELMKKALADARKKATDIANLMNKKIGAAVVVSDMNTGITGPYSYPDASKNYYQLIVRFPIE